MYELLLKQSAIAIHNSFSINKLDTKSVDLNTIFFYECRNGRVVEASSKYDNILHLTMYSFKRLFAVDVPPPNQVHCKMCIYKGVNKWI